MDLLILGSDRDSYFGYAKNIRKEYAVVHDGDYKKDRREILNKLLNSQFIYRSKKFREVFEKPARENIIFELNELL